mmetsp:Transcript_23946/g.83114  ORF Transcript_23946/g.83114 Transcript_23946/m.83114 type:complete len:245 (-) Transcript_23946:227-961(-)
MRQPLPCKRSERSRSEPLARQRQRLQQRQQGLQQRQQRLRRLRPSVGVARAEGGNPRKSPLRRRRGPSRAQLAAARVGARSQWARRCSESRARLLRLGGRGVGIAAQRRPRRGVVGRGRLLRRVSAGSCALRTTSSTATGARGCSTGRRWTSARTLICRPSRSTRVRTRRRSTAGSWRSATSTAWRRRTSRAGRLRGCRRGRDRSESATPSRSPAIRRRSLWAKSWWPAHSSATFAWLRTRVRW